MKKSVGQVVVVVGPCMVITAPLLTNCYLWSGQRSGALVSGAVLGGSAAMVDKSRSF